MSNDNQCLPMLKSVKSFHLNPSATMPHSNWGVKKGMSFKTVK